MEIEEAIETLKKLSTNCGSCTLQYDCTFQQDKRCLLKECFAELIRVGELLLKEDK